MEPDLTGLEVGGYVIYVDEYGFQHSALVTAIWGDPKNSVPCINVVFVSPNEKRQDECGRQIERKTSVIHKTHQPAHGFYYMMPGDTPNPVAPKQS